MMGMVVAPVSNSNSRIYGVLQLVYRIIVSVFA